MAAHEPVMTAEVLDYLAPQHGGVFVDCTVGLGGHVRALLVGGASRVLGLDRDRESLSVARTALSPWADRVELVHTDFRHVGTILDERGITTIDGALADLGMSAYQIEAEGRGFSFRRDEPLDMRMDRSGGPTAAELLCETPEAALADVIFRYGEERYSRRVARGDRRGASHGASVHDWATRHDRPARLAQTAASADRPGDAHVSGASDLGQR